MEPWQLAGARSCTISWFIFERKRGRISGGTWGDTGWLLRGKTGNVRAIYTSHVTRTRSLRVFLTEKFWGSQMARKLTGTRKAGERTLCKARRAYSDSQGRKTPSGTAGEDARVSGHLQLSPPLGFHLRHQVSLFSALGIALFCREALPRNLGRQKRAH